ncbi:hypothetical protein [Emticicia fontis]
MRVLLCIFFYLGISEVVAQTDRKDYIPNKYSFFMALNMGNPVGAYRTILKEGDKARTRFGASIGLLVNPLGKKKLSPIMLGVEGGILSYREASNITYPGNFYLSGSSSWLNGVVRYRPILWSSIFNPYADIFYGTKFIKTSLIEKINEENSQILQKWARKTPNYGIGIGVGIKLIKNEKNGYLDIGVYYQKADATGIVKPNSVQIDNSFKIYSEEVLTTTNQLIVKVSINLFNFRSD